MLQGAQLRGRLVAGGFVVGQFGRDFVVFQAFGIGVHEDLVNAKRGSNGHARRNGNSFAHTEGNVTANACPDKGRGTRLLRKRFSRKDLESVAQ